MSEVLDAHLAQLVVAAIGLFLGLVAHYLLGTDRHTLQQYVCIWCCGVALACFFMGLHILLTGGLS